jgi:hypothetical protein
VNLRDYYRLRKDSFSIDPREDAHRYFGGSKLDERLRQRVETDFVQQRQVPKFCIYGPYGAGKTHNLHHIAHDLRTNLVDDYPSEPILLDISPIRSKERWRKVHSDVINAIGLDRIKEGVHALLTDPEASKDPVRHLTEMGVLKYGEAAIKSSQGKVFRALAFGGPMEAAALQWLKGTPVSKAQAETIEIETELTEVSHLVACLLNVAALLKVGLDRRPVLLVDEAEALRALTAADSINEFKAAFRKLAEDENNVLGLIVAFQVEGGMEDAPEVLVDPSVFRRFGYEAAFIDLQQVIGGMENVKVFIEEVLDYLVDQDAARGIIEQEGLPTDAGFFPFTPEAVDRLAEFILEEDPRNQVPSQIITRMSNAVVAAWRRGRDDSASHVLVDDELIEAALYPSEQE